MLSNELNEEQFVNIVNSDEGEIFQMTSPAIGSFTQNTLLKVAELTSLAYSVSEIQDSCQGHWAEGFSIVPFFDRTPSHAGNVYFKEKEVIVSFRGTWNGSDVLTDLNTFLAIPPFLNNQGRAHSGFYSKFCESCYAIRGHIDHYIKTRNHTIEDLDFIISGHSMGGGIATIFALWFAQQYPNSQTRVATFGSPRTLDFDGAAFYEAQLGKKTIRVVQHHIDPIATVTNGTLGYKHVGQQLRTGLSEGFYPHQILGYIRYIQNLPPEAFTSVNSASVFWPISYTLGIANSVTIGNLQQFFTNIFWKPSPDGVSWEKKHL